MKTSNIEIRKVLTLRPLAFTPKSTGNWRSKTAGSILSEGLNSPKAVSALWAVWVHDWSAPLSILCSILTVSERGFEEFSVPMLVNRRALEGTGQLPKFEDDLFQS
jgi:seryl-tRNA synthetase